MDRILTSFIKSKYFTDIIDTYNPLSIFITGSRAAGINNQISDYDLCVLVPSYTGGASSYPDGYLQFIHKETGLCIHYFIREMNELFINKNKDRLDSRQSTALWKGLLEFGLSRECLYIRDDFNESWSILNSNHVLITKAALFEIYKLGTYGAFMMESAMAGELHPHRDIIYLLLETYLIAAERPGEETLARFKEIRNMTREEIANLPKEEKELYIARIQNLVNTFEQESSTFESYLDAADNIYNQIGL